MTDIENAFCPNKDCKEYGLLKHRNIAARVKYGKDKTKYLLYCPTCGKRFAPTRSTAFFGLHLSDEKVSQIIHHAAEGVGVRATARLLNINKDTVNRGMLRAGEHCEIVLSNLLRQPGRGLVYEINGLARMLGLDLLMTRSFSQLL